MDAQDLKKSANPSSVDILAALSDSGYLMEQRVASSLEELGFHVKTNRAYEDPDEGKSREIDVSALKSCHVDQEHNVALSVELIVECKNFKLPVVTITRRKNEFDRRDAPKEHLFPFADYFLPVPGKDNTVYKKHPYFAFGLDKVDPLFHADSKGVQFCRIDGHRKKWEANHSGMHESILLPVIKATIARRNEIAKTNGKGWSHVWLAYSVVVLSNELYVVDSHDPSVAQQVGWATLVRDNKSATIDGRYAISFVTEDAMQDFIAQVIDPVVNHLKRAVEENPKQFKDQYIR
ncbi:hypothetical protein HA461_13345 [Rhizobium leguminosarum bv. trifolii]|uniref:hypothetical protein n=1 Tax=Rhizobium leguminosarum TaxID=384 RepID=UPI00140FEA4A|nr:hypothetical protein [Rhizobium leguminosarum]QIO52097.1 hypothetical protein HA461_13345 [Rhizobium leguminosarum bv. trifolii]